MVFTSVLSYKYTCVCVCVCACAHASVGACGYWKSVVCVRLCVSCVGVVGLLGNRVCVCVYAPKVS